MAALQARPVVGLQPRPTTGLQARPTTGLQARPTAGLQARPSTGGQTADAGACQPGYDRSLLVDGQSGEEMCFEEVRGLLHSSACDMSMTFAHTSRLRDEEESAVAEQQPFAIFQERKQPEQAPQRSAPFAIFNEARGGANPQALKLRQALGELSARPDPENVAPPPQPQPQPQPLPSPEPLRMIFADAEANAAGYQTIPIRFACSPDAAASVDKSTATTITFSKQKHGATPASHVDDEEDNFGALTPTTRRNLEDTACIRTLAFTAPEPSGDGVSQLMPRALRLSTCIAPAQAAAAADQSSYFADSLLDELDSEEISDLSCNDDDVDDLNNDSALVVLADTRRSSSLHEIAARRLSRRISLIGPGSLANFDELGFDDYDPIRQLSELQELVCSVVHSPSHVDELRLALANSLNTLSCLVYVPSADDPLRLDQLGPCQACGFEDHFVEFKKELTDVKATHASSTGQVRSFVVKELQQDGVPEISTETYYEAEKSRPPLLLRISSPPEFWEGYIAAQVQLRLEAANDKPLAALMPQPAAIYIYRTHGYYLCSLPSEWSLKDTLNQASGASAELLAVYRAVEILRLVEGLHRTNVLHGALSPAVFLLPSPLEEEGFLFRLPPWTGALADGWEKLAMHLSNLANATDATLLTDVSDADFSYDHRGIAHVLERCFDANKAAAQSPLCVELLAELRKDRGPLLAEQSVEILAALRQKLTAAILPKAANLPMLLHSNLAWLRSLECQRLVSDQSLIVTTTFPIH